MALQHIRTAVMRCQPCRLLVLTQCLSKTRCDGLSQSGHWHGIRGRVVARTIGLSIHEDLRLRKEEGERVVPSERILLSSLQVTC
jgi:hypothetical protein